MADGEGDDDDDAGGEDGQHSSRQFGSPANPNPGTDGSMFQL